MTTLDDLATVALADGRVALAVGWLGGESDFPCSEAPDQIVADLRLLAAVPKNVQRGLHYCEFCDAESPLVSRSELDEPVVQGTGEIWIDDGDVRFVSPTLIVHYVEAHHYHPPERFRVAVARAASRRRAGTGRGKRP